MSWTVQGKVLAAETEVNKNTPVEVVVSQGPKPHQIPELRGLTWEQIRAALDGVQLKAVRQEDIYSDKWKLGVLAKVEPGIETVVPRGTEVKIWISKGPDVVTVPNVYADSAGKAAQKLTEAGLVQGTIDGPIDRRVIAHRSNSGHRGEAWHRRENSARITTQTKYRHRFDRCMCKRPRPSRSHGVPSGWYPHGYAACTKQVSKGIYAWAVWTDG